MRFETICVPPILLMNASYFTSKKNFHLEGCVTYHIWLESFNLKNIWLKSFNLDFISTSLGILISTLLS